MSATYTIGDEIKNLRNSLEDMRRRIMVPIGSEKKPEN